MSGVMERAAAPPGGEVSVSYVPTVDDLYRVSRAITLGRWHGRALEVGFPALMALNLALVAAEQGWRGVFRGFALVFPLLLALWLARPWLHRARLARHLRRNPALRGTYTLTVSGAGLRVDAPSCVVELAWSGVRQARETQGDYLLYVTDNTAHFIPRRALRERDEDTLRALLAGALGERARLRTDREQRT